MGLQMTWLMTQTCTAMTKEFYFCTLRSRNHQRWPLTCVGCQSKVQRQGGQALCSRVSWHRKGGSETITPWKRDIASSSPRSCLRGWRRRLRWSQTGDPSRLFLPLQDSCLDPSCSTTPLGPAGQTLGALDAHRPPSEEDAHQRTCSLLTFLFTTKTGITGLNCRTEEGWWLNYSLTINLHATDAEGAVCKISALIEERT